MSETTAKQEESDGRPSGISRAIRGRTFEILLSVILFAALFAVLMTPTIKANRTVEVKPEGKAILLEQDTDFTSTIKMPGDAISYFIVWVQGDRKDSKLEKSDFETLRLEITGPEGDVIRSVTGPVTMRRRDEGALFFRFEPVAPPKGTLYNFTVRQMGEGIVWAEEPFADMAKDGETAVLAFQLGEARNWLTLVLDRVYDEDLLGHDISYYYHRGYQITEGVNPYSCILQEGETCIGYPSHLPGLYMFAAGTVLLGVEDLEDWAAVWRPLMLTVWLAVGLILFGYLFRLGQPALGVAAAGFWLFNRWSLYVLRVSHTDFVGVFFVVVSFIVARRIPLLAALLLGISISIKPVAAVLVPLFLIIAWRSFKVRGWKLLWLIVLLLLVPVAVSLPLYLDDPASFKAGVLNPVNRPAQTQNDGAPSFDRFVDVTHLGKSMPMLVLIFAVYAAAWRKSVDLMTGSAMIMAIVIAFTHVLFTQYFIWFVPFVPLALGRYLQKEKPSSA